MNPSGGDWKAMFQAVRQNDESLVRFYLKQGIDPNYQHPEFLTSFLIEAAQLGHVEIVELLLDKGADPVLRSEMDACDALEAARRKGHQAIVRRLEEVLDIKPSRSMWARIFKPE